MRAARDDGLVADVVARRPGAAEERAFEPAFAVLEDLGPLAHRVLEAEDRRVDGVLQLVDLPRVLDQSHLGQEDGELVVRARIGLVGHERIDVGVDAAVDAGWTARRKHLGQLVDVPAP